MSTLQERIADALAEAGLKPIELAKLAKVSRATVSLWVNGPTKIIEGDNLTNAAKALGVDAHWLATGEGHKSPRNAVGLAKGGAVHARPVGLAVHIPMMSAKGSMGAGMERPEEDTIIGDMPLSKEWVRRNLHASNPANLATISAYGDSMAPTFSDGDILLVDTGITELKVDAVYVIDRNGNLFIKRVQRRLDGSVVIKSDNPLYDPHVITDVEKENLRVLGRVLWAWNGRRL